MKPTQDETLAKIEAMGRKGCRWLEAFDYASRHELNGGFHLPTEQLHAAYERGKASSTTRPVAAVA